MFSQRYRIGYRGLDAGLRAGAFIIIELLQETGTRHTDSTVFPMSWYAENKKGFIITGLTTEIFRAPCLGEEVLVETAALSFHGAFAERFYYMYDASGLVIARSYTSWAYIDLVKRRPERIPRELGDSYGVFGEYDGIKEAVIPPAEGEELRVETFRAPRRDADSNMHINNIAYLNWAAEYVPGDVFAARRVKTIRARYRKECAAGDMVTARTYSAGPAGSSAYLTVFSNADGNRLTEILTEWE